LLQLVNNPKSLKDNKYVLNTMIEQVEQAKQAERKLYDVFLLSHELDMLELRLTEHDEAVDNFIIVESAKSFTLLEKPLYYQENKDRYKKWENKIIYLVYDLSDTNAWNNEYYARNFAKSKLDEICQRNDIVLTSDLDEIVSLEVLKCIKANGLPHPCNLQMDFYYYNCKWILGQWYLAGIAEYHQIDSLQAFRQPYPNIIANAGWHLSYFMNEEDMAKKLQMFSHTEYSGSEYTNRRHIRHCISTGIDLFNRSDVAIHRVNETHRLPRNIHILPAMYQRDYKFPKIIGFHQPHLTERGTSVALYDYAYYNETLLGNKSIIIYQNNHSSTHPKMEAHFREHFKCITYNNFSEVTTIAENENIDILYSIKYGYRDNSDVPNCLNVNHAVFEVAPHGDRYATISEYVCGNNPVPIVPHMISLKPTNDDLRSSLGIPKDDIVIGRYGGMETFNIAYVHETIKDLVNSHTHIWFLFMNTNFFYHHPHIIYHTTTVDPIAKAQFINTCDAMLHARLDGETFGLSVGEFSVCNKPIITSTNGHTMHIKILKDLALIYHDTESLKQIILSIKAIAASREDWNAYKNYAPEPIMKIFEAVFLH
jgi:hypothetical protein